MGKYVVEVLRTVVARVEVDAISDFAAREEARRLNEGKLLDFHDAGLEDDYEVVELPEIPVLP